MNYKIIQDKYPEAVAIGLTRKCNLSCLMCPYRAGKQKSDLPFSIFRKIDRELFPHVDNVFFCGSGESILYPEFLSVLGSIKKYKFKWGWHIATNGLLIDDKIAQALIDGGAEKIIISVDAATDKTYRRIRGFLKRRSDDISLARLAGNLNRINLIKAKIRKNNPRIWFNFLVMRFNLPELPLLVRIAGKYKVDRIQLVRLAYQKDDPWKKYAVDINDERSRRIIGKSIFLGSKLNVKITLEFYEGNSNCNIPCPIPWKWAIINENGEFMPCSWISKSRCGFEVGNLRRNNFMEIWNNDRMKELRKTILDGTYSFCGKYASPNCAHLINRRIVVTAKRENQS